MGPKAKDLDKGRTEWIKKLDQMKERDKDEDEDKDKDKDKDKEIESCTSDSPTPPNQYIF